MSDALMKAYAQQYLPLIHQELRRFFTEQRQQAQKISPHAVDSLHHIEEFVFRGGKFVRSLLVVIGFRLAGGKGNQVTRVAVAVELLHKYILSLDDMADRDAQRYGGPTLWKAYQDEFAKLGWVDAAHHGRSFSEIDGALMSSFVTELVRTAQFPAERLLAVFALIDQIMYMRTIGGWQIHYFQNQQNVAKATEAEYLKGLDLVSSQYSFIAPLQIGATLAGGEGTLLKTLGEYGTWVGQAFQMQDDVLGMFGENAETGKPVGNDFREGKKTLLLQYAYHSAKLSAVEKQFLSQAGQAKLSADDIKKVQNLMRKSGALMKVQQAAQTATQHAQEVLNNSFAQKDLPEVEVLRELTDFVITRKF